MARLENITRGSSIRGILPEGLVTVLDVKWLGTVAVEVTYKDSSGRLGNELIYRDREPTLEVATEGQPWSFDGDGALFRLVSEAHRIRLAHLFDPLLAVHTSLVDPLPHQITAVYEEMLPRQPLRFLLADDPGAGKTGGRGSRDFRWMCDGPEMKRMYTLAAELQDQPAHCRDQTAELGPPRPH